jgi:hypothetical protein
MANRPELETFLRKRFDWEFQRGKVDFQQVRSVVSSPRLMSFSVRCFSHPGLVIAGESYLSQHTMIADGYRKTYAISHQEWLDICGKVEFLEVCEPFDSTVMNIQIWPFKPEELDSFSMAVAVALSFSPAELMAESRISLAADELVSEWGYKIDD